MAKKNDEGRPPNRSKTWDRASSAENKLHNRMDQIAAFEEWHKEILPILREAISSGMTPENIYKKFGPLAAARGVSIALTERDSGKALTAIKEVLDRSGGKAIERQQVTHKLEQLPDEQLDALVFSKLKEVEGETTDAVLVSDGTDDTE